MNQVRIGVLGAARIVTSALLAPARGNPDVTVAATAARDPARAAAFARRHRIPRVHSTYDELLADPDLDAVYIPLPNSLHCPWTLRALAAGKHVLCEKPFAANAGEAEQMASAAARSGRVLMEAFHYRYHPLAERMREIVASGALGRIRHIETWMCFPLPLPRNIRYRYDLAGGATMDAGAYAIHMLRLLAGMEPAVTSAHARLASPNVDRFMSAELRLADGATARMTCSMWSSTVLRIAARVEGDRGTMEVLNPVMPQYYHRLTLRTPKGNHVERFPRTATYTYQLRAFVSAIQQDTPILTSPADSVANMRLIDAVYQRAGLPLRGMALSQTT